MKRLILLCLLAATPFAWALDQGGAHRLSVIQERWAEIQYRFPEDQRAAAFEKLAADSAAFTRDQDKLREQMGKALQGNPFGLMEDQARRNMEMFTEAMRLWAPFAGAPPKSAKDPDREADIEALRRQVQEMQKTIETIAKK